MILIIYTLQVSHQKDISQIDHIVEMLQDRLGGLLDVIDVSKEPLDNLDSKARSTSQWFNQIPRSFKRKSTHDLDISVVAALKLLGSWTEDVPDR